MSKHTKNILNITAGIVMILGFSLCAGFSVLPIYLTIPINFVIGFIVGTLIARTINE